MSSAVVRYIVKGWLSCVKSGRHGAILDVTWYDSGCGLLISETGFSKNLICNAQ